GPLLGDEDLDPVDRLADPVAEAARRELRGLVREAVARLPEKLRAPVVLCYLDGKTNEQAARELGRPAGAMSRRLEEARRLLRDRLTGLLLAGLLCLLSLLGLAGTLRRPVAQPTVAGVMSRLEPTADRPGAEEMLRRLAQEAAPALDRGHLLALAREL